MGDTPTIEHVSTLLAMHAAGEVDRDAAGQLLEVLEAVADTGKKGSVTIHIEVSQAGNSRQVLLTMQARSKVPQPAPELGVYFVSREGLHHTDPWQQSLDAIDPDTGEIRPARDVIDPDTNRAHDLKD